MHVHLRAWRKRRCLTLEALAEMIGSRANTISGWETGNRAVDLKDLKRLAAAYGVHPAALLMAPDDYAGSELMRQAADLARRMPEDVAATWLQLGEKLTTRDD